MANKKTLNIVLLIIVVAIWGMLIHRVVKNYFHSNPDLITMDSSNFNKNTISVYNTKKDTFELKLYKRDPFLKTSTNLRKEVIKHPKIKKKLITKEKPKDLTWPNKIVYLGYLKREKSNSPLALLKINNILYRVKKKEEIENILIEKIYTDSIILKLNSILKTINKE